MMKWIAATILVLFVLPCFGADALSPEEAKAQAEFKKAFSSSDPVARRTAVKLLFNAKHPSSWQLLAMGADADPDRNVKLNCFNALCQIPARDASVAKLLAKLFTDVKRTDHVAKLYYAKDMQKVEFKADIVAAMVDYVTVNLRYPEYITADQSMSYAQGQQKEYLEFMTAFNKIVDSGVVASSKATNELKKWYKDNKEGIEKADRELIEKYKKEDAAKKTPAK